MSERKTEADGWSKGDIDLRGKRFLYLFGWGYVPVSIKGEILDAIDRRDARIRELEDDVERLERLISEMLDSMHWTDHATDCPQYRRSGPSLHPMDYGNLCHACIIMRKAHEVAGWTDARREGLKERVGL